jgi:hypothetical protein
MHYAGMRDRFEFVTSIKYPEDLIKFDFMRRFRYSGALLPATQHILSAMPIECSSSSWEFRLDHARGAGRGWRTSDGISTD